MSSSHPAGGESQPAKRDRPPLVLAALAVIVLAWLAMGTVYAVRTPRWQAPDEPAHFNYVAYLVQHRAFPVLQPGDFPAEYLERLKADHFPADQPIDSIRYESHQPPLYYLLGAVVYRTTAPMGAEVQFLALRLLSVLLGAAVLLVAFATVSAIFPAWHGVALGSVALAGTLPMHLAVAASVNNDLLAELMVALIVYLSVRSIRDGLTPRRTLWMGVLVGLALLTKTTTYLPAIGVVGVTWLLSGAGLRTAFRSADGSAPGHRPNGSPASGSHPGPAVPKRARLASALLIAVPAALLSAPWFLRNALVYGDLDTLAWRRHALVAAGQPTSADLLAAWGATRFVREFALTVFRSYWAQFGWMGVLVDQRIYIALALLSATAVAGLVIFSWRLATGRLALTAFQKRALALLVVAVALTGATLVGYNAGFYQPQGRYLFVALVPMAVLASLGLSEALNGPVARRLALIVAAFGLSLLASGLLRGRVPWWSAALAFAGGGWLALSGWAPPRTRWVAPVAGYCVLLVLDWMCIAQYIVPYLR